MIMQFVEDDGVVLLQSQIQSSKNLGENGKTGSNDERKVYEKAVDKEDDVEHDGGEIQRCSRNDDFAIDVRD